MHVSLPSRPTRGVGPLRLGAATILALLLLRPGWAETAILGGLGACLALAAALADSLGPGPARGSISDPDGAVFR
ncbi:hypothetical protein [Rubellimicrobium aerolatum]|uniref:Uncharacterized protein n=1 Tax=Rubellimicrobium aerolatum TaxID=490979 RepID=A0ABW0SDK5_9RHOB|nr:hypothetical protein [Rubellimicrobium aerolatum]MBP1805758.1 hypothetical protein [Rubellimicrobium aerolatum]